MKKSHWILVGFMVFNTACVIENAFPGWSALYASAREAAGSALDLVAAVTDHWVNRHGIYFPTYPEFEFIAWSEASLYLTLGLLVRLLVKSELELHSLRRERREREAAALNAYRADKAVAPVKTIVPEPQGTPDVRAVTRKSSERETSCEDLMTEDEWGRAVPVDMVPGRLGLVIRMAIDKNCWMVFDYDDQRYNHTSRRVKPLSVISCRGGLYMEGFCSLRGAKRTFKLSRMSSVWVIPDRTRKRKGA